MPGCYSSCCFESAHMASVKTQWLPDHSQRSYQLHSRTVVAAGLQLLWAYGRGVPGRYVFTQACCITCAALRLKPRARAVNSDTLAYRCASGLSGVLGFSLVRVDCLLMRKSVKQFAQLWFTIALRLQLSYYHAAQAFCVAGCKKAHFESPSWWQY